MACDYIVADCIDFLKCDKNSYDMIYLDPPYSSMRDYRISATEPVAFSDKLNNKEYKDWIDEILVLCKLRLSSTGTLWFHIAAEYSFAVEGLLNKYFKNIEKIFWKKSHGKNTVKNKCGSVIDILFRCFDIKCIFNIQKIPLNEEYVKNSYNHKDDRGFYGLSALRTDRTRRGYIYEVVHKGVVYSSINGWKIKKEVMDKLISDDMIHFVKSGNLYKKLYRHEISGKPLSNLWDDIHYITRSEVDCRYYPTQKPVKLIERIVNISTNKDGRVLDPFAGSGTIGVVCNHLGRNCILLDINNEAKIIFEKRTNKL